MSNDLEININSLICRLIANIYYFFLEILVAGVILIVLSNCFNLHFNTITLLLTFSVVILSGELIRQNKVLHSRFINNTYSAITKTINFLKSEPIIIVNWLNKLVDFTFIPFFLYNFYQAIQQQQELTTGNHNIYGAVSIIITVATLVLTIVFTAIQQFENRYSDFKPLIQKWKHITVSLFITLTLYATASFIAYFKGSNVKIDFLILVASIYLFLKLILVAVNFAFLMNFDSIMKDYQAYLLRWLKRWNISKRFLSREFDEEKIYKDVFRKGFLNFLKYKVWGINRRKFHTIPTEKIQELKNKIEPLFRISEVYLKENNINNFKLSLEIISNITRLYSEKYNNFSETNYYFFVAGKLKQLFEIAIKLNYQSFPEYIVEINEKICLSVIREKKSDAELFNNNQTASVGAFKSNAKDFIAMSINLDNTPAPALAITTLRRVFSKLLFNNSLDEANLIVKDIEALVVQMQVSIQAKIIPASKIYWILSLTNQCIYEILNSIYQTIIYSMRKYALNTDYLLKQSTQSFIKSFEVSLLYNTYPSNYSTFFQNLGGNTDLQIITNLLIEKPFIQTPRRNLMLNGYKFTANDVNSLKEIFNVVFVSDLVDYSNFNDSITALTKFLKTFITLTKLLLENNQGICVKQLMSCLNSIQGYAFLFIKRLEATNYKKEELLPKINKFLEQLYLTTLDVQKQCFENENSYNTDYESFIEFIQNAINYYLHTSDKSLKSLIETYISSYLKMHETLQNQREKDDFYRSIRLITLLIFKDHRKSKIFKVLFTFIVDNYFTRTVTSTSILSFEDRNNLPYFAHHWNIDTRLISDYRRYEEFFGENY